MSRAVLQVFRVQSAMSVNRALFWLKKLPLVRRALPDRLYGARRAKQVLMAVVEGFKLLWAFGGKFLYLWLFCLLPVMLTIGLAPDNGRAFSMFVSILFFMSFFVGCFLTADSLSATLVKYTCVRQMSMSARTCIAATTGRTHVLTLLSFTPALLFFTVLLGQPWWYGALLSLELAACRCLGELFHLVIFTRTGRQPGRSVWFILAVVLSGLGLAYGPLSVDSAFPLGRFLLNPAVCIALIGCGAWAAAWLCRYPGWRDVVRKTCRADTVSTSAARANAAQNAFKDVRMKESDLSAEDAGERVRSLRGYAYLNALFFRRHRRLLTRPMKFILLGVGVCFAAGLVCALLFRDAAAGVLARLPSMLPVFVYFMYFLCNTLGQRICKAMFYNCDVSLLRFGWYRERSVVLRNFAIRLSRVALMNLVSASALCLAVLTLTLVSGAAVPAGELVPFLLCILCLAVFFSVHPLFLYYVFQPYTAQLAVKNPFFSLLNIVVYFLCFACLYIKQPPAGFALLVLAATLAYSAAALVIVWKRAPQTFRVK